MKPNSTTTDTNSDIHKLLRSFWFLVPLAFYGLVACSGEPVIPCLKNTFLESYLDKISYQNAIIFNLCAGFLTSVFFWYLVVYKPEKNRRKLAIQNFRRDFETFKQAIIQILLGCSQGWNGADQLEELLEPLRFRSFFSENKKELWNEALSVLGSPTDEGGDEDQKSALFFELAFFSQKIEKLLSTVNLYNTEACEFFEQILDQINVLINHKSYSYEIKYLGAFLWKINALWYEEMGGYQDIDPIETHLKSIERG